MATFLTKKRFLLITSVFAVWSTFAMGYAAYHLIRYGGLAKTRGWSAARRNGAWTVAQVDASGPAANKLAVGDRIAAIDGQPLAAKTGPEWFLRDRPDKLSYEIAVEREGALVSQKIDWPTRVQGSPWLWTYLIECAVYLYVGLGIAFFKPESAIARRGALTAVLMAGFFCASALSIQENALSGFALVLGCLTWCVMPYHVVASYWFTSGFPQTHPAKGGWRRFTVFFYAWAFLLWLPSTCASLIRASGPENALRIAAHQPWLPNLDYLVVQPLIVLTAGLACVAIVLVLRRNYLELTDAADKRRLRWVIFGMAASVLPVIAVVPVLLVAGATGHREQFTIWVKVANTIGVVNPICIAYAIVKHKVLGIRVVLRAGVQYLLAKSVLRIALLLPLLLIAAYVAFHPSATFGDLVKGEGGRVILGLLVLSALALTFRNSLLNRIDRRFFREGYRQDQIFLMLSEAVAHAATVEEVSHLLCSEIQKALHPRIIFSVSRANQQEFTLLYSDSADAARRTFFDFALTPAQFESLESAGDVSSMGARTALERLGIQLVVPIRGPNEGLLGLLLLGERLSEEPYSRNDRRMLDTVASQTGVVWENLQLRSRLREEQQVRKTVMARVDGAAMEVVLTCPACGACYDAHVSVCMLDGRALTPSLPMARLLDGKYLLTRMIGHGGMGVVYEAQDQRLDRVVAVKVTSGNLFGDQAALQRFAREARAAAKLNHINVVRVFDIGELSGGGAYMVFEFLRGVTLRREIRNRIALPVEEAALVLGEIAAGMEEAHRLGIVHRDLKPENVFLARETADGQPVTKILDFGLAVIRDLNFSTRERLTKTGAAVGTLSYMSREQFLGETVDERTDVYSLGVVALEALSGEISMKGPMFPRIREILDQRLCGPDNPAGHRNLADVLRTALAEEREARFASIYEFRVALIAALEGCPPIHAVTAGNTDSIPTQAATQTQAGAKSKAAH